MLLKSLFLVRLTVRNFKSLLFDCGIESAKAIGRRCKDDEKLTSVEYRIP